MCGAEARLCNGNKVHILAGPLLQYLRALLAADDLRAHRSLATQVPLPYGPHHLPINAPTAGAQAFLMDYT
jgi:hypothetical protein